MKYIVIESFVDKNSRKTHKKESIYETEDKDRAEYLIEKGYLKQETVENVDSNTETILEQTIAQIVETVTNEKFSPVDLEELLATERKDKNRKGVIEHIESLLKGES